MEPFIGLLARETILLRRAYDCAHQWEPREPGWERCVRCGIEATPDGKAHLARMAARFHGRSLVSEGEGANDVQR
jgi:hypothetical protein